MKSLLVITSLALGLWGGAAAATEAFVVNVPLEFKNFDAAKVSAVAVHCKVAVVGSNGTYLEFHPVKTVKVALQGGAYVGTAKVVFQVEDFVDPERSQLNQVNHTRCNFTLIATVGELDPHATKPQIAHDVAAPFVWQVDGKFAK